MSHTFAANGIGINLIDPDDLTTANPVAKAQNDNFKALKAVAVTGAYSDLTGAPTLAANTTSTTHQFFTAYNSTTGAFTKAQPAYADVSGTPTLATVATSGDYSDLTGAPTVNTLATDTTVSSDGSGNGTVVTMTAGSMYANQAGTYTVTLADVPNTAAATFYNDNTGNTVYIADNTNAITATGGLSLCSGHLTVTNDGVLDLCDTIFLRGTSGSASFATNAIGLNGDGTASFCSGNVQIGNTNGNAWINSDGSASFANGETTIGSDGSITVNGGNSILWSDGSFQNGGAQINEDGSASFENNNIQFGNALTFAGTGSIQLHDGGTGYINFNPANSGGSQQVIYTQNASIFGDGSATFAGSTYIASDGAIHVNTSAVILNANGTASFANNNVGIDALGGIGLADYSNYVSPAGSGTLAYDFQDKTPIVSDGTNWNLIGLTKRLFGTTTDGSTVELFTDGISGQLPMPTNSSWQFDIQVSAYDTTSTFGFGAGWQFRGCAFCDPTTTAYLVGTTVSETWNDSLGGASATPAITGVGTNCFAVQVTGIAGHTIKWNVIIRTSEIAQ